MVVPVTCPAPPEGTQKHLHTKHPTMLPMLQATRLILPMMLALLLFSSRMPALMTGTQLSP